MKTFCFNRNGSIDTLNVQCSQSTTGNLARIFQVSFMLFLFCNIFRGSFQCKYCYRNALFQESYFLDCMDCCKLLNIHTYLENLEQRYVIYRTRYWISAGGLPQSTLSFLLLQDEQRGEALSYSSPLLLLMICREETRFNANRNLKGLPKCNGVGNEQEAVRILIKIIKIN